jgi:radical SAM superfamily enzyme YgiQ (UPF0313 family)
LLPLSVLYLVRPLRQAGFDPVIIDQRIDRDWRRTLSDLVTSGDVPAVGISAMTGQQVRWGLEASAIVRKLDPDLPIVWGGVHGSLLPEQTVRDPHVDIVVRREGEETFPELLQTMASGKDLSAVAGIAYLDGDRYVQTEDRAPVDLDPVMIPDYDAVNVEDYITSQTLGLRDLAIMTSRGCPNRCAYCYNIPYSSRRWRAQSAEKVVDHIEQIVRNYRVQGILVKDDNFFVNRKRVEKIAEGLAARNLNVTIRGECRADYIAQQWDQDFLDFLGRNGFREMTVGAESGSDETLGVLCKDITVADIKESNRRLAKAGISAKFTFMTGYPNETTAHVRQTLQLMLDLVAESRYARVTPLHLFSPYPGTELFDLSVKHGHAPPDTLAGWADVDFHQLDIPWLEPAMRRKLERASLATYFLDGRTVPEYFAGSRLMQIVAKVYSVVVRWRAKRFFFGFMPELALFQWYRKRKEMVL